MPRIGSILTDPIAAIERVCTQYENEKQEALRKIKELEYRIHELDKRIQGYRHTYKWLQDESNLI